MRILQQLLCVGFGQFICGEVDHLEMLGADFQRVDDFVATDSILAAVERL